eukprot:gene8105-16640_t
MGAAVPIFQDFIADNLVWKTTSWSPTLIKGAAFNFISLLILFLPDLIDFLIIIPNNAYILHFSIFYIRVGCTCCVICSYLNHYGGHIWQHPLLKVTAFALVLAPTIRTYRTIGYYESIIFQYSAIVLEFSGIWIIELAFSSPQWYNRSSTYLAAQSYLFTFYLVTLTVYQGRAARREAAVVKVIKQENNNNKL